MTLTVGQALVSGLALRGVEIVFGIPGVHTIELYRGLPGSGVRHVTPRHEQGAGFMADGYARVTGKPGVAFVITGPGLTNAITAMAQARADSIPMLVVSGVNARADLGRGKGLLHELPDQAALIREVAVHSHTLLAPEGLDDALDAAFAAALRGRPGPVHLEIPLDLMAAPAAPPATPRALPAPPRADVAALAAALREAKRPVLLLGGGAARAGDAPRRLAAALGAPAVMTTNARGLLGDDALRVPASPSLKSVRALLAEADLVLALGTEFGQTDYDGYADGGFPALPRLARIDLDRAALAAGPPAEFALEAEAREAAEALLAAGVSGPRAEGWGAERAEAARADALEDLGPRMRRQLATLDAIRAAFPEARIVGDSTQPVYAGDLYCEAPAPLLWFNSATGYGTIGYAPGAAIGAALAEPDRPTICLVGDGGLQFSLAELGAARDEAARVIFLVWNNEGYGEIESAMRAAGAEPIGVRPSSPDLSHIAAAYGLPFARIERRADLAETLRRLPRPSVIELPQAVAEA